MVQPPIDLDVQPPAAMLEMTDAWQDVLLSIDRLQKTVGRSRESLTEMTPTLARAPEGWRTLDQFLFLERMAVELGRIADAVRRGSDEPVSDVE